MARLVIVAILIIYSFHLYAQPIVIKGIVFNESGQPVHSASVLIRTFDSLKIIGYALTNADGGFQIDCRKIKPGKYQLLVRHISFTDDKREIVFSENNEKEIFFQFNMKPLHVELREIFIKREPPIIVKSDTVQFTADHFRKPETRKLEDLLKNINGFYVDANGRISFNGKMVEKVLIDGDDLADEGYRMITRNLSAGVVDKVQVIDNYNDNRLLRNISQSGKVGINIKISKENQNHPSGNITAGFSANKRYEGEANFMYLATFMKMLAFINANNVALDPLGDVRYYYATETGDGEYAYDGGQYNILSSGSIFPPPINEQYTSHNKDAAFSLMSSWKLGRYAKIKALAGVDWLKLFRSSSALNRTFISDTDNWETSNLMAEQSATNDKLASLSFHRDALKKHITDIDIDFWKAGQLNRYSNISSGALVDSLTDRLENKNKFYRLRWEESIMIRSKSLFRSGFIVHKESLDQYLKNLSDRFSSLFGIASEYNLSNQYLNGQHLILEWHVGISGQKKDWEYSFGTKFTWEEAGYEAAKIFSRSHDMQDYIDTGQQKMRAAYKRLFFFLHMGKKIGRKSYLNFQSGVGPSMVNHRLQKSAFPEYELMVNYSLKITSLKSLQLKYGWSGDFGGNFRFIYPDGLISGNGNVLNGLVFSGPVMSQSWKASYHSTNLFKSSQWSANLSYSSMKKQYSDAVYATSAYTISQRQAFEPNSKLLAIISADKFLQMLKSKLGFSVSYYRSVYGGQVNNEKGISILDNYSLESRLSTGFKIPFNIEIRATITGFRGSWNGGPSNLNQQYTINQKLKWTIGKKAYSAIAWNYSVLSSGNSFNGLDLFLNWHINPMFNVSLKGTNLLNTAVVAEKFVTPYTFSISEYQLVRRYVLLRVDIQL